MHLIEELDKIYFPKKVGKEMESINENDIKEYSKENEIFTRLNVIQMKLEELEIKINILEKEVNKEKR